MQPPSQTFPVLSFLGVLVQFGGALMLVALFVMLRRFVLRRAYFGAWMSAWLAFSVAIAALAVRLVVVPAIAGSTLAETHPVVRASYFVYQFAKGMGFILFLRGTLMYVAGTGSSVATTRRLWVIALVFAIASTLASRHGLNEMVIWQSAIAVPALGYCASALLWLPRRRKTFGNSATGACFAFLGLLWLMYAGAFGVAIRNSDSILPQAVSVVVSFNTYFDLAANILLGYSMVLILMEDAKRQMDDAQAELQVTHDQLRRAALYDSLTDSMNRRAFAEGVGLDMVRATFGTVVLADLDNLKTVNDEHGHSAGDQLLRRCADVLRSTLRPYDKLYRWCGDEFLLIVPSAHANDVIERIRNVVEAAEPVLAGPTAQRIRLAVSLGAADFPSSEELALAIEHDDRAMYADKSRRKSDPRHTIAGALPPTSVTAVR